MDRVRLEFTTRRISRPGVGLRGQVGRVVPVPAPTGAVPAPGAVR